ncbi:hypothetical protein Dtox_2436 [Desulfofarcimen acetoxidans DSM 771]|uniref:Uncharacterized protein n=1 Tax=Desulfofarcimen acetoxidans (strain ATCC 49208 / DSM 771 / KCTC 5769 / VKM B-1644 / 5575) TaxID=485916 RepID=C8W0J1_DESAS|nr:hypothetical protein [Desulfofarcimen acetoxidans]ACV63246.1 hypothetical protein Dtox_2436 [Desulfofarcimen acetoxidans DSM 771]
MFAIEFIARSDQPDAGKHAYNYAKRKGIPTDLIELWSKCVGK